MENTTGVSKMRYQNGKWSDHQWK